MFFKFILMKYLYPIFLFGFSMILLSCVPPKPTSVSKESTQAVEEIPGETVELRVENVTVADLLQTLEAAAEYLRAGRDVTVTIPAGEYRAFPGEVLALKKNPGASGAAALRIEGDPEGGTILSGAYPAVTFAPDKWTEVSPELYRADWPQHWQPHAGPWLAQYGVGYKKEASRREQIFLNGRPLRLVMLESHRWEGAQPVFDGLTDKGPEDLLPGQFGVISFPGAVAELQGHIWMRLPEGMEMTPDLKIDVPRFTGRVWRPMLEIDSIGSVTLRHLTVRHANAGPSVEAVAVNRTDKVLIEDCAFDDNVNGGLKLTEVKSGRLSRVSANRNGSFGMVFGETRDLVIEDCESSYNNFRGVWEHFIHWHPAGMKMGNCHGIRILRHLAVGNHASGIWTDVWGTDIEIKDSLVFGNQRVGIMLELSKTTKGGGYRVLNSLVAQNLAGGVFFSNAIDCKVSDSVLAFNGWGESIENARSAAQLVLKGHDRPGTILVRDMRPLVVENSSLICGPETYAVGSLYTRTTADDLATLREGLRLKEVKFAGDKDQFFLTAPEEFLSLTTLEASGEVSGGQVLNPQPKEEDVYNEFLKGHPLESSAFKEIHLWLSRRASWLAAGPGGIADQNLIE